MGEVLKPTINPHEKSPSASKNLLKEAKCEKKIVDDPL
jgi:hypothetical protein